MYALLALLWRTVINAQTYYDDSSPTIFNHVGREIQDTSMLQWTLIFPYQSVLRHIPTFKDLPVVEEHMPTTWKQFSLIFPVKDSWTMAYLGMQNILASRNWSRGTRPRLRAMYYSLGQSNEFCGGKLLKMLFWWKVNEQTKIKIFKQLQPDVLIECKGV